MLEIPVGRKIIEGKPEPLPSDKKYMFWKQDEKYNYFRHVTKKRFKRELR